MEDGPPMVAKFYRPERWSDFAILEEHVTMVDEGLNEWSIANDGLSTGPAVHDDQCWRLAFRRRLVWRIEEPGNFEAVVRLEPDDFRHNESIPLDFRIQSARQPLLGTADPARVQVVRHAAVARIKRDLFIVV